MVTRQQIYRKLSVLFYEKDRELVEELEKLSIEREDSMSKIVKQLISKELEQIKRGWVISSFFLFIKRIESPTTGIISGGEYNLYEQAKKINNSIFKYHFSTIVNVTFI